MLQGNNMHHHGVTSARSWPVKAHAQNTLSTQAVYNTRDYNQCLTPQDVTMNKTFWFDVNLPVDTLELELP